MGVLGDDLPHTPDAYFKRSNPVEHLVLPEVCRRGEGTWDPISVSPPATSDLITGIMAIAHRGPH